MKIDNKDDKPNYGRLHVDYATAQDDHYEYNCQQRQLARELRHRRKLEEERLRPPSPPLITDFTESEASLLQEKLKSNFFFFSLHFSNLREQLWKISVLENLLKQSISKMIFLNKYKGHFFHYFIFSQ